MSNIFYDLIKHVQCALIRSKFKSLGRKIVRVFKEIDSYSVTPPIIHNSADIFSIQINFKSDKYSDDLEESKFLSATIKEYLLNKIGRLENGTTSPLIDSKTFIDHKEDTTVITLRMQGHEF